MHLLPRHESPSLHSYAAYPSMSSIQGQPIEVTVVGCNKLKDTEWISRQDPYVCLEYANSKFRTRTCTDGHKNPTFQEKFVFPLIEGLREINVAVWNSNTLTVDDFIGSGRVLLQKVISQGFDDCVWPLQSKHGRYAGEVRLIMHFAGANKATSYHVPPPPMHAAPSAPYVPMYTTPPPSSAPYTSAAYPPVPSSSPYTSAYAAMPPNPSSYMPTAYPSPAQPSAYPPQTYPSAPYPPQPYPPQTYPPAPYPPGPFPGLYPPPPY